MNIGERLRFLREQSGISGKALAEKIGLVPSQINKIEHNVTKPSIDSLERICGSLGITLGEFFSVEKLDIEPELRRLLQTAKKLTPAEREKLIELIDLMKNSQGEKQGIDVRFDNKILTEKNKAKIKASLDIIFWDTKQKTGEKISNDFSRLFFYYHEPMKAELASQISISRY